MAKNWPSFLLIFFLSVTSVTLKIGKEGVEVELQRTQQRLAAAEADNAFSLAGVECMKDK